VLRGFVERPILTVHDLQKGRPAFHGCL
jgi:hypothetical protein